jgi:hypothetical protein
MVVGTLVAALSACADEPGVDREAALEEQATAWCAHIGHPDLFCHASFRSAYGYQTSGDVDVAAHQTCLADMAESARSEAGWQCPASCDAIWLGAGQPAPIWP